MNRFAKAQLLLQDSDSQTVKELKRECNKLITRYNELSEPLSEPGQSLNFQINDLLSVIDRLKESNYKERR